MKPKKKTTTPFPPKGYRHKVWEGDDMRSGAVKPRGAAFGYEDNVIDRTGGRKMGMDLLDLDSAISRIKTEILPGLDTMVKGWIQIAVPALKTAVIDAGVAIVNRALGGLDDQRDAIKEIIDGLSFSFKRVDVPTLTPRKLNKAAADLNPTHIWSQVVTGKYDEPNRRTTFSRVVKKKRKRK